MRRLEPFFIVEDPQVPIVDDGLRAHLRARRLSAGAVVWLGDGRGMVQRARICALDRRGVALEPEGEPERVPPRAQRVGVASFLPTRERLAWMVAKLAEVGVDWFWPLVGEGDRRGGAVPSAGELERLRRIAREAAQQAEQAWVLQVAEPTSVAAVLPSAPAPAALADPGGDPPDGGMRTIVIGPESGIVAGGEGLPRVRLPGGILRVETAAVVGGTLLVAFRDGIVDRER
jgi:RsmE family RNA methyltransferase